MGIATLIADLSKAFRAKKNKHKIPNTESLWVYQWVARTFSMSKARKLLEEVLTMDDVTAIHGHMELVHEEAGLGGLIRVG